MLPAIAAYGFTAIIVVLIVEPSPPTKSKKMDEKDIEAWYAGEDWKKMKMD
jgi:hypothetical protein